MSEGEDRADRLSRRRRERSGSQTSRRNTGKTDNTSDTDNTRNTDKTDNTENTGDTDKTDNTGNTGDTDNTSNKTDEKAETETVGPLRETAETQMMRLTNDQYRDLHHVYNRLKADYEYEFDEEFELNRHFFPLVLDRALSDLRELDPEELRTELKELN